MMVGKSMLSRLTISIFKIRVSETKLPFRQIFVGNNRARLRASYAWIVCVDPKREIQVAENTYGLD